MKAFVMLGLERTGFAEKPIPVAGPNDAIIKTTYALICTSDSHTVRGAIGPRENLTLGHTAVGVVHSVGSEVRRFRPGDRVVVGAITPDWGSEEAQNGYPSQSGGALGGWKFANIKDGVFAEYFHVNEADVNMALIPESISPEKAVYGCNMMSTGFMAAEHGSIPFGNRRGSIPRIEWGVGMADKTIRTGLCPGGRLRRERLLRILEEGLVDPTRMTIHTFDFDDMARAFEIMDGKLDGVLKPLIRFA
jgi:threonine dehydrogenase-like Zn-dependent dehydrogenase